MKISISNSQYLPSKLLMLDLEMSGLNPKKDDILQVAALKLELRNNQYVETDSFDMVLKNPIVPANDFQKKFQAPLFKRCNASPYTYEDLKDQFIKFLGSDAGKLSPCGDCVPTDVLFLYAKDIITLSHYEGDTPVDGTFHYEYFDMNAIKLVMRHKMGFKADKELKLLEGIHDGLVDCRNQLIEMNFIISKLLS